MIWGLVIVPALSGCRVAEIHARWPYLNHFFQAPPQTYWATLAWKWTSFNKAT